MSDRIKALELEIERLKKVNLTLKNKIKEGQSLPKKDSFGLFEKNVILNDLVSVKTNQIKMAYDKIEDIISSLPGIFLIMNNVFDIQEVFFGKQIFDHSEKEKWNNYFYADHFKNELIQHLDGKEATHMIEFKFKCDALYSDRFFYAIVNPRKEGVVVFVRDITELHNMENALKEQEQNLINSSRLASLGEMAGGIAHEINNPLTIITSSTMILKKLVNNDRLKKEDLLHMIDKISLTSHRITKIVAAMKNLSRSESPEASEESFVLLELFDDVVAVSEDKIKNTEIDFKIESDSDINNVRVSGSRVQISQIILNLINNAVDAIAEIESRWIRVNVSLNNHLLTIKIIDSGEKIPPHVLKRIFEPFFTTKNIGKGTGLGLSLSRSLARKNCGDLFIDDSACNTCFTLVLNEMSEVQQSDDIGIVV